MDALPEESWATLLLPGKSFPGRTLGEAIGEYDALADADRARAELLIRHPSVFGPLKRGAIDLLVARMREMAGTGHGASRQRQVGPKAAGAPRPLPGRDR